MLRKTINKIATLADELDQIDYEIETLKKLANLLIERDVQNVDMVVESLPNTGVRPTMMPLYAMATPPELMFGLDLPTDAPDVQHLGYRRWYEPKSIKDGEVYTVNIELSQPVAMAMIDTILNRLRKRRAALIEDSKRIIKPS